MSWVSKVYKGKFTSQPAPPSWEPAPEESHALGLYSDVPEDDFESAERFCAQHPPDIPKLLPSYAIERIKAEGCRAWGIQQPASSRFAGYIRPAGEKGATVKVITHSNCRDVSLLSELPLLAGLYDIKGKQGIYYEVLVHRMNGTIGLGTACRPWPEWRFPGWNRLSAGLHFDDFRKFFEDPNGGRDYTPLLTRISPGDTIGCGYDFARVCIFFTYNGQRLPDAFTGVYVPRTSYDVYAAVGVEGSNEFDVNFGGELFRWQEGNEWAWRVEGHVGQLTGSALEDDELPTYDQLLQGSSGW